MQSIDQIRVKQKETDEFNEWRRGIYEKLPELANRVFALRDTMYKGRGFHYCLEKDLGYIIREMNNLEDIKYYHTEDAFANRIVLEVVYNQFIESLTKSEETVWTKQ